VLGLNFEAAVEVVGWDCFGEPDFVLREVEFEAMFFHEASGDF